MRCVGSSSGATFFPDKVVLGDNEEKPIEMKVFSECPQLLEDSLGYAVQQGAGMVVTNTSEQEIRASVRIFKVVHFKRAEYSLFHRFRLSSGEKGCQQY